MESINLQNAKMILQRLFQRELYSLPQYRIINNKRNFFIISVDLSPIIFKKYYGIGKSIRKKEAEKYAALNACYKLRELGFLNPEEDLKKDITAILSFNSHPKVALNEVFMKIWRKNPQYIIKAEKKEFIASICVDEKIFESRGNSKKSATSAAALLALEYIAKKMNII
ncbi:MAG: putative dsRNA-binding protein [Nitrososphaerota archaeon]